MSIKSRVDKLEEEAKNYVSAVCPECGTSFPVKIPPNKQVTLNVVYDDVDVERAQEKVFKAVEAKVLENN